MLSWNTKIKLELMANGAMFATLWTQHLGISEITFITTIPLQLHHHSSVPLRHSILLRHRLRMTRPFGIWCQRGRDLEECCVIYRGSSLLAYIWNSCIALACLISVVHELWLACNNLWDLRYGVWCGWELELVVILWWFVIVISFCLSYDLF
jgi:hypothetical protein